MSRFVLPSSFHSEKYNKVPSRHHSIALQYLLRLKLEPDRLYPEKPQHISRKFLIHWMNKIHPIDPKLLHKVEVKSSSPFEHWDKLNPSPEMLEWRKKNESIIDEAFRVKKRVEILTSILNDDIFTFCDECDGFKCYGSFFPICEPILEKIMALTE